MAPVSSISEIADSIGTRSAGHIDLTFRRMMPQADIGPSSVRMITGEPHPFGNAAVITDPADANGLREIAAPLLSPSFPAVLILPFGASEQVKAAAKELGFTHEDAMPAMAIDLGDLNSPPLPPDCEFRRITESNMDQDWTQTLADGYGLPFPVAQLFSPLNIETSSAPDADVQFFALMRDDKILATSMLHLADGLAGIYCIAVLPDERGRGLGGYVTAATLQVATDLGYQVGVLQSSAEGHSIYRRLGFRDVETAPMYLRLPEEDS